MLDETNLRRLAEMGIDVYRPRAQAAPPAPSAGIEQAAPAGGAGSAVCIGQVEVLLLAAADSKPAAALLADVARALRHARVGSVQTSSPDEAAFEGASVLVAFGDARARAAGAQMPAQRQQGMAWIVSAELHELARSAQGKRALWSELRRSLRGLAARRDSGRR